MKAFRRAVSRSFAVLPVFAAAAVLCCANSGRAQSDIDCGPVIENFRQNVESAPSHVLTLLEDALIANGGHCVPAFVQTAIEASGADSETVKKIVFVAVTNAQSQAPQIAESAVSAAPKHADAVREAFAEAFEDNNPRLKPAKPAEQPAWAQENSPVPEPKNQPKPKPQPKPQPKPEPTPEPPADPLSEPIVPVAPNPKPEPPMMADNNAGTNGPSGPGVPFAGSMQGEDEGWKLLHDGVVDQPEPIDPRNLTAGTEVGNAPDPVEPPLPETRKKKFPFALPSLPSLPKLPELTEVSEPIDLFFHEPFGGIPPVDSGS